MSKNIHIEHPEDSIFTGDLSVLDAFLLPLLLSLKIDGAPSIVWGRNPATGLQFVGTKSVFNKKNPVGFLCGSLGIVMQPVRCLHLLESYRQRMKLSHHGRKRTNQNSFERLRTRT